MGLSGSGVARRSNLLYSVSANFTGRAEVAELADAPDSKSGGAHPPCGFDSHLRHQKLLLTRIAQEQVVPAAR